MNNNSGKYSRDALLPPQLEQACLSVLVPAFNEAATISTLLDLVLVQPSVAEVIAVDDGSNDGTGAILEDRARQEPRLKVQHHPVNKGKGAAVHTALELAQAPLSLIQDADLEYSPGDYNRLLEPIRSGEVVVVYGSRFLLADLPDPPWHKLSNNAFTALVNLVTGLRLTDASTCYKLAPTKLLKLLALKESDFGFCPELTVKIKQAGLAIHEVPIAYQGRTWAQGKKLHLRDGLLLTATLLRYSWGTQAAKLE